MKITRIPLSGAVNTRDLGGFETTDGHKIRSKRLLRSSELSETTLEDRRILNEEYALKTVVDFRTNLERQEKPEISLPDTVFCHLPIMDESTMGITHESKEDRQLFTGLFTELAKRRQSPEEYMTSIYRSITETKFSRSQYGSFLKLLENQTEGSTLWHCSAGKDRAGLGTALVLLALDVPRELIVEDYLMTGVFLKEKIIAAANALAVKLPDTDTFALADCLLGVRESYIDTLFDIIDTQSSSPAEFLESAFGLDRSRQRHLKEIYLD